MVTTAHRGSSPVALVPPALPPIEYVRVHGHRRAYRRAGSGPVVLLIHGIGDNSATWSDIMVDLARDHEVIAPDLLGHGQSDKPRGDYSIGGFANAMRDLLSVLGVERATVVGHSMGAGVAMQFAYQYPERCERLVLVGAGGVSRSVTPVLRVASLPGSSIVIGAMESERIRHLVRTGVKALRASGLALGLDAPELLRVIEDLPNLEARTAFVRTLRSVVDLRGQVVTMLDRCYLAAGMPTQLVWGTRDSIVPSHHALIAHAAMPGSRLELFEGAGHFPFRSDPARFLEVVRTFMRQTQPAEWSQERWRQLLRKGEDDVAVQAV